MKTRQLLPLFSLLMLVGCSTTQPQITNEHPITNNNEFTVVYQEPYIYGILGKNDELRVTIKDNTYDFHYIDEAHMISYRYKPNYLEVNYYDQWALPDVERHALFMGEITVYLNQLFF